MITYSMKKKKFNKCNGTVLYFYGTVPHFSIFLNIGKYCLSMYVRVSSTIFGSIFLNFQINISEKNIFKYFSIRLFLFCSYCTILHNYYNFFTKNRFLNESSVKRNTFNKELISDRIHIIIKLIKECLCLLNKSELKY